MFRKIQLYKYTDYIVIRCGGASIELGIYKSEFYKQKNTV